jgi:hypothetical protein
MKITNKIIQTSLVVAGTLFLTGASLPAATHKDVLFRDQGVIQNIDRHYQTFTMKDPRGAIVGIEWNAHSHCYGPKKTITFADLKPGEMVRVRAIKHGETLMAERVWVYPPASMAHKEKEQKS